MKVKLLSYTNNPELIISMAAKLCYSEKTISEISNDFMNKEDIDKFINMLLSMNHLSPIEHASFTFGIEGVSRSLLAQITRHRIASYSVKSQRYVRENKFDYIVPESIKNNDIAYSEFCEAMKESQKHYDNIIKALELNVNDIKNKGKISNIKKIANENARAVLPNACSTQMVVTMNARELMNFFNLRCCNRAQDEIRLLANKMLELCKEVCPTLFANAGASCVRGKCSEGKMSCGNPIKK